MSGHHIYFWEAGTAVVKPAFVPLAEMFAVANINAYANTA